MGCESDASSSLLKLFALLFHLHHYVSHHLELVFVDPTVNRFSSLISIGILFPRRIE